jgi:hypothetical protein
MPTQTRGRQIKDDDVGREDINVTTIGRALATKVIAGTNIGISYTGADVGTGDVTVGLSGVVGVGNGGTGVSTITGVVIGNATSAFTGVAGTSNQVLRRNTANTAYEFFTLPASVLGTIALGQVAFGTAANTVGGDNGLFWDNTNKRLGIGTASPQRRLDVFTTANSATEYQFSLRNGQGSNNVSTGIVFGFNTVSVDPDYLSAISSIVTNRTTRAADLTFLTAATGTLIERMRLNSAGNLGLGVTPSAWGSSTFKVLDIGSTTSLYNDGGTILSENSFINSSFQYIYKTTNFASRYDQVSGQHRWFNAPSGTAGNSISFTQAMTLGSNSGLSIGTPSAAPAQGLLVQGAATFSSSVTVAGTIPATSGKLSVLTSTSTLGATADLGLLISNDGSAGKLAQIGFGYSESRSAAVIGGIISNGGGSTTSDLFFATRSTTVGSTAPTERMRITSAGNVGIGTASPAANLHLAGGVFILGQNKIDGSSDNLKIMSDFANISGSSTIEFSVDNSEKMRIFNDGNVLIQSGGTFTNAGFRLDVNGTGRFSGNLLVSTTSTSISNTLQFVPTNTNGQIRGQFILQTVSDTSVNTNDAYRWKVAAVGGAGNSGNWNSNLNFLRTTRAGVTDETVFTLNGYTGAATFSSSVTATNGNFSGFTRITGVTGVPSTGQGLELYYNASTGLASVGSFDRGAGVQKALELQALTISLKTGGSERMLITSGGNVLIGTTTDNSNKLRVNGTIFSDSSVTATSFFESSDATIKTLVEDAYQAKGIDSVVAKLYIKNGKQELGYYAQDLEGVLPSAVSKGSNGLLNLSYREVHTAKIAYLEQRIKQLENELVKPS